jgi:NMD protein affecting ribosome stability and mRNA decay
MLKFCGKDFNHMTNNYKLIQLTNTEVGDVAVDSFVPVGSVTRRINAPYNCCNTFVVTSSTNDSVVINDPGFYKVTYSLTATAAAAGQVSIALVTNGASVYTVSQTIVDETTAVDITLPYVIRVCPNCSSVPTNVPVTVQIQNTGIALTGSTSNLIIEKI